MRVTNNLGLPEPLVRMTERPTYSKGASRISVTTLLDSPRIGLLKQTCHDRIVVDVADNLWALVGTAIHKIMEMGADEKWLSEERLFATVDGWVVSGGIDVQMLDEAAQVVGITDYKFTGAWAVQAEKPEWERQLNSYAWLVHAAKGYRVERLTICAFIRDWSRHKAARDRDYPQHPAQMVRIPLWSVAQQEAYVKARVQAHKEAQRAHDWGDPLPTCTDEERWLQGEKWAVVKAGGKRAIRVLDTEAEAEAYAENIKDAKVVRRVGEYLRCANYCPVAQFCDQWRGKG